MADDLCPKCGAVFVEGHSCDGGVPESGDSGLPPKTEEEQRAEDMAKPQ